MRFLKIDEARCLKDGLCVRVCHKVFTRETEDAAPVVAHEENCNSCGHCVMICPSGAIIHDRFHPGDLHPVDDHLMPTYEQVHEMIITRRSIRNFQDRHVEKEMIAKVIDSARFAPSAKNSQSTQFIVIQEKTLLRRIAVTTAEWLGKVARQLRNPILRKLYLLMGEKDADQVTQWIGQFEIISQKMRDNADLILFEAPVLLLFHGDKRTRFAEVNANLALQNATLAACALGLGSFYTGYVVTAFGHIKSMSSLVGLPSGNKVYGGLALGYPLVQFSQWIERNPPEIKWM